MCKDLGLIIKNEKVVVSSLIVAERFNKNHDKVLRDVRRISEKNKKLKYIESYYINKQNKKQPMYILDYSYFDLLKQKYELRTSSNSLEKEYIKVISDIFPDERKEYQKEFLNGKYRVDIYIPMFNMIIEIDEKEHEYKKEYDAKRDLELMEEMKNICKFEDEIEREKDFDYSQWCSIIHVKEGELGQGIRKIMLEIERITWHSPCNYM